MIVRIGSRIGWRVGMQAALTTTLASTPETRLAMGRQTLKGTAYLVQIISGTVPSVPPSAHQLVMDGRWKRKHTKSIDLLKVS